MPTVQGMTLACIRVNVIAIRCQVSIEFLIRVLVGAVVNVERTPMTITKLASGICCFQFTASAPTPLGASKVILVGQRA